MKIKNLVWAIGIFFGAFSVSSGIFMLSGKILEYKFRNPDTAMFDFPSNIADFLSRTENAEIFLSVLLISAGITGCCYFISCLIRK